MSRWEALRYARGVTRAELARETGISRSTLERLERPDSPGRQQTKTPTAPVASALARFYGVAVEQLLNGDLERLLLELTGPGVAA